MKFKIKINGVLVAAVATGDMVEALLLRIPKPKDHVQVLAPSGCNAESESWPESFWHNGAEARRIAKRARLYEQTAGQAEGLE